VETGEHIVPKSFLILAIYLSWALVKNSF
jgi:hypothetical protein